MFENIFDPKSPGFSAGLAEKILEAATIFLGRQYMSRL